MFDFKLAGMVYANAMFAPKDTHLSYEQRWGAVNALRKEFMQPYMDLFPEKRTDFSCGPGWWPALEMAFETFKVLMLHNPEYKIRIAQIKEKFGDLRLYVRVHHKDADPYAFELAPEHAVPEELRKAVDLAVQMAEQMTWASCEVCGDLGEHDDGDGWTKKLCRAHTEQRSRLQRTK